SIATTAPRGSPVNRRRSNCIPCGDAEAIHPGRPNGRDEIRRQLEAGLDTRRSPRDTSETPGRSPTHTRVGRQRMGPEQLRAVVSEAFANRELLKEPVTRRAVHDTIDLLDLGRLRVAEKVG